MRRRGIIAYGDHIPRHRLRRSLITEAVGTPTGPGQRSVAAHDEDTTSMGVEAARAALAVAPAPARDGLGTLTFATTRPAYLDKTNATALHAALALDRRVAAFDMVGSVRSAVGAIKAALTGDAPGLVVLSDVRTGRPGSRDEWEGGDGAAALVVGPEHPGAPVVAEVLGAGSATAEMADRWRRPGEATSRVWEERFARHAYLPLARAALDDALADAALDPAAIDHLAVTGTQPRVARELRRACGVGPAAVLDDLVARIGNTGTAHPGLLLVSALDRARPGQTVVLVVLADGVEALVLRATDALAGLARVPSLDDRIERGGRDVSYHTFLTWREMVGREPPRRPLPAPPSAPPALRNAAWKFAFTGSRCEACDTVHLPPARVCASCRAVDRMVPVPMADRPARVLTFAVDRLAATANPPLTTAVLDFDGGGRFECELTDVSPASLRIGDRMEMTFRRLFSVDGVHDYFWKARPVGESRPAAEPPPAAGDGTMAGTG